MCEWQLGPKWTAMRRWSAGDGAVTAICSIDAKTVLTASVHISVRNAETGAELKRITGHASAVSLLVPGPGRTVLSGCPGHAEETIVNVWQADGESSKALVPLALPVPPAAAAATRSEAAGQEPRVAVVSEAGTVHLFQYRAGKRQKKPLAPVGRLVLTTGDLPSQPVPVRAVAFPPARERTHVMLARGSAAAPVFEEVQYVDESGERCAELTLVRDCSEGALLGTTKPGKKAPGAAASSVVAGAAVAVARRGFDPAAADDARPLSERVRELGLGPENDDDDEEVGGAAAAAKARGAPRAGSLAHMLAQALHSKDDALLEECLNNTGDAVVRSTVARLPPTLAVQFLIDVVHKLEARPSRGVMLMVWIKAVLMIHSSYLMTVPDLPEVLSSMYALVDSRLSVFPRMLKLCGRLDLLLSQVALKSAGAADIDADELQKPEVEYVEESSEGEEDDGDGEMDWETEEEGDSDGDDSDSDDE